MAKQGCISESARLESEFISNTYYLYELGELLCFHTSKLKFLVWLSNINMQVHKHLLSWHIC